METWTLRDRGRALAVTVEPGDGRSQARLLLDHETVATGAGGFLDTVKLSHDDLRVKVELWRSGHARAVELFDHGDDGPPAEGDGFGGSRLGVERVPFVPPPGTRAARRHAWQQEHPKLWAVRHVAAEGLAIVLGVLGIGALVSALFGRLLPSLDLGWLPDLDPPRWLRTIDPIHWLGRLLPDVSLPEWDLPELGWLRYVMMLAIAALLGVHEYRKRRRRERREAGEGTGAVGGD